MSTLSLRAESPWALSAKRYAVAAIGCAVFSAIYEFFSHGVFSNWMIGLFAYPLLLGALPAIILARTGAACNAEDQWLLACGIFTLTVGSCLLGVLEIYGSTSRLTAPYLPVGIVMCVIAFVLLIRHR